MTMQSWAGCRLAVAGCLVVLGVAACAGPEANDAPPPSTVERQPSEAPKDRDERAVFAALARIDLCSVLQSAATGTPRAPSPSTCQIRNPQGTVGLRVERLPAAQRLRSPSRTLGGAKAYVRDHGNTCWVSLPVSFELALTVDVANDVGPEPASGPCAVAEEIAAAVATTLAEPAVAQSAVRWEACAALGSVPDVDVGKPDTMDSCATRKGRVVLEFGYAEPGIVPSDGWQHTTVDGVEVLTLDDPDPDAPSCTVEWSQGPASRHADDGTQLVISLRATDCRPVTPLVKPLITTLREPPAEVKPQRPLLYGPDDPDSPLPGACAYADLPEAADCAPYVEVAVPAEPDEISRGAAADPNVNCAVAHDAVVDHFGAQTRPVTVSDNCYFVQPDRLVQIVFAVSSASVNDLTDGRAGAERIEIAGHPGFREPPRAGRSEHEFWVATSSAADQPSALHLVLSTGPVATGPLPAEVAANGESALADIVRTYFS